MKFKFLLRNWSSVSAAAAVLLGSSSRASATKQSLTSEGPKFGDGNPYEPLILKPPAAKMIPEERFAGHRSHSSHASHASHASHYSGSYQPRTYSPPEGTPVPPPPRAYPRSNPVLPESPSFVPQSPTRIDLLNGTIIYGTVLAKSAAGITMRASDGTNYKFERKQLSTQTITDLALPPEERTIDANQLPTKTETTEALEIKQKNEELEQANAALRRENAALRNQTQGIAPEATPATAAPPPSTKVTYRVVGLPKSTPYLNIRTGAGADYPVVGALAPGARGISLGPGRVTNGWTVWQEITGGGYTGWVNAQYLAPEAPMR